MIPRDTGCVLVGPTTYLLSLKMGAANTRRSGPSKFLPLQAGTKLQETGDDDKCRLSLCYKSKCAAIGVALTEARPLVKGCLLQDPTARSNTDKLARVGRLFVQEIARVGRVVMTYAREANHTFGGVKFKFDFKEPELPTMWTFDKVEAYQRHSSVTIKSRIGQRTIQYTFSESKASSWESRFDPETSDVSSWGELGGLVFFLWPAPKPGWIKCTAEMLTEFRPPHPIAYVMEANFGLPTHNK
jgi:hypothetical protein